MASATADAFFVDTSPFSSIDRRFLIVLVVSIGAHFLAASWVASQPTPLDASDSLDEPVDRFVAVRVSPLMPIPKIAPVVSSNATAPAVARSVARTVARPIGAPDVGLLKLLGGAGPNGLIADVFGSAGTDDIAAALRGATAVRAASADDALLTAKTRAAQTSSIGEVGTTGVQAVVLAARHEVAVKGRVDDAVVDVDASDLPPEVLQRFIAARKAALQSCYEQQLSRHQGLKGRLQVRFFIGSNGRAREVTVGDEGLNSPEVASCVQSTVSRWTFPLTPQAAVPVSFPLVFSPAS